MASGSRGSESNWFERSTPYLVCIVGAILTIGGGAVMYLIADLSRDVGAATAGLQGIDTRFSAVDMNFKAVDARFDLIDTRFASIDKSLAALADLPKEIARIDQKLETVSRDVDTIRGTQQSSMLSVVQGGNFTAENREPGEPHAYRWALKYPVEAERVVNVIAEPVATLSGIAVSATLDSDGKACTMRLYGSNEDLADVPVIVPARLTISYRP